VEIVPEDLERGRQAHFRPLLKLQGQLLPIDKAQRRTVNIHPQASPPLRQQVAPDTSNQMLTNRIPPQELTKLHCAKCRWGQAGSHRTRLPLLTRGQ
jgi:hypothetical protein